MPTSIGGVMTISKPKNYWGQFQATPPALYAASQLAAAIDRRLLNQILEVAVPTEYGAVALMKWLGENMPEAQAKARSFANRTGFHDYMRSLTGVNAELSDSHDDICEAYLEALRAKALMADTYGRPPAGETGPSLKQSPEQKETKRPPLDWDKPTPFDPFPGFETTSRSWYEPEKRVMQAERDKLQDSPDLSPTGHLVPPNFGSAFINQSK